VNDFTNFNLAFHVSYMKLRETKKVSSVTPGQGAGPGDNIADLSFLTVGSSSTNSSHYTLCQAHISIVICGWSNTQWTGYAFANTGLDDTRREEADEDDPIVDWFAADSDDDYVRLADASIWDARRYWLLTIAIRCQLILKEWEHLVDTIEDHMRRYVRRQYSHSHQRLISDAASK
jgi:hypothetical protein